MDLEIKIDPVPSSSVVMGSHSVQSHERPKDGLPAVTGEIKFNRVDISDAVEKFPNKDLLIDHGMETKVKKDKTKLFRPFNFY